MGSLRWIEPLITSTPAIFSNSGVGTELLPTKRSGIACLTRLLKQEGCFRVIRGEEPDIRVDFFDLADNGRIIAFTGGDGIIIDQLNLTGVYIRLQEFLGIFGYTTP
jgi:hypothetical protein